MRTVFTFDEARSRMVAVHCLKTKLKKNENGILPLMRQDQECLPCVEDKIQLDHGFVQDYGNNVFLNVKLGLVGFKYLPADDGLW